MIWAHRKGKKVYSHYSYLLSYREVTSSLSCFFCHSCEREDYSFTVISDSISLYHQQRGVPPPPPTLSPTSVYSLLLCFSSLHLSLFLLFSSSLFRHPPPNHFHISLSLLPSLLLSITHSAHSHHSRCSPRLLSSNTHYASNIILCR